MKKTTLRIKSGIMEGIDEQMLEETAQRGAELFDKIADVCSGSTHAVIIFALACIVKTMEHEPISVEALMRTMYDTTKSLELDDNDDLLN
jgi:hypothetical protein